jgi:hypothetical protein
MSREAERWNIDLGVENRGFRKATRAGQPKGGSRMRLPEEVSKKREVTSSPVAEGSLKVDVATGHYTAKTHSALEPEGAFSVEILMIG